MATNSIKQTIETIEDTITNFFNDQVRAVYFEKFSNTQDDRLLPCFTFYYADGSQFGSNVNSVAFECELRDSIVGREDEDDRRKEVVSDCFQIASKIVAKLKDVGLNIEEPITPSLFDNMTNDGLGGVSFVLVVNIARPCLTI